ncbi:MAG: hypothetical protein HFI86_02390 [Bacilli bacterium]|nr:hypothetical protein [Bacilli bacterium]MCI9434112.1 hypothetical protein [Bacilli bacterium]
MTLMQANKEICATCGGMSCKKRDCDDSINNFKSSQIYCLQKKLVKIYLGGYAKAKDIVDKSQQMMKKRNVNIEL